MRSLPLSLSTHTRIWIIYTLTRCDPMGNIGWTNHFISFQKSLFFSTGSEKDQVCVCIFWSKKRSTFCSLVRLAQSQKTAAFRIRIRSPQISAKNVKLYLEHLDYRGYGISGTFISLSECSIHLQARTQTN